MSTQDGRKLSSSPLHDLRQSVVAAVEAKGMKAVDAMRIFGIGRTALFRCLNSYRSGDIESRAPGLRGRTKGHTKLQPHQAAAIVRLIGDRCPDQRKLPFALWTREAVHESPPDGIVRFCFDGGTPAERLGVHAAKAGSQCL